MKEEKLLSLLQKKRGFFEAILELSETESHLPLGEWISILEQKKILLACVDEIDEQLSSFKESFFHLSQEIAEEIDHIKKVIESILHLDQINCQKRKKELISIKKQ